MRVNLSPDSAGGGPVAPAVHVQNPEEVSHVPPPSAPAAAPGAPPAAAVVIEGDQTEETIRLKRENDELKATVKQREQEHASVTDEFQRYKDATEARNVPVTPGKVKQPTGRRFLRR